MVKSRFESEYAESSIPEFRGHPAPHRTLRESADAEPPWWQMSVLLRNTAMQAVQSFYLAKRHLQYFSELPQNDDRVGRAVGDISSKLMRMVVIDIAALNDGGLAGKSDLKRTRSASLPVAHARMSQLLADNDASADEVDHLGKLQDDINCDMYEPLKYVRHLRSKWAAHPSLDRHFDDWADADK